LKFLLDPTSLPKVNSFGYLTQKIVPENSNPLASILLVSFITFINALLINRLSIKNHLFKEHTLLPGMFYALFSSILITLLPTSDVHFATFFIILAIQSIFSSYNNVRSADDIFLAGFYMSTASLFYFPTIILLVFGYFGFSIMRSFTAKEGGQYLIGWLTPLYLTMIYQYYVGDNNFIIPNYFFNKVSFSHLLSGFTVVELIIVVSSILLCLYFLINYSNYMGKKVIVAQKRISILYFFLFFIFLMIFFYTNLSLTHLVLLIIPACIFITFNILEIKNNIWPEIIHLLLIILLVINHLELIKLN
jgi:hypothetical protein